MYNQKDVWMCVGTMDARIDEWDENTCMLPAVCVCVRALCLVMGRHPVRVYSSLCSGAENGWMIWGLILFFQGDKV